MGCLKIGKQTDEQILYIDLYSRKGAIGANMTRVFRNSKGMILALLAHHNGEG